MATPPVYVDPVSSVSSRSRMPRRRAGARRALALLMVLLGLSGPGAIAAQDGADVVVNVTVAFTAPYAPETGAALVPTANGEFLLANGDDVVFVANGDFDQPGQIRLGALEGLDAEVAGLVPVDAGTSGDPQYWLDLFTIDDRPYGAFTLARSGETGETVTMFLGPVQTFADGLAVAQQSVTVDGAPIFDGVDPGGLQILLDAALPNLEGEATPPDDAAPTETATDDPDASSDQPGITGEGSYESPHHGFVLTWSDEWILDPEYDAPVASDVNLDFDEVHLTVDSPQWVWFSLYAGVLPPGVSFADFMEGMSSPQRLAVDVGASAELVVSRVAANTDGEEAGALIIRVTVEERYDLIVYEEYRLDDDGSAVAALQMLMLVEDVEPGLEASEGLEFEGGPVVTLFTFDEILSATEDARFL